jgi:hypothetical protein
MYVCIIHKCIADILYICRNFCLAFRECGDHIHDLLEKQADLIRYLKDRNANLSHKIMLLSQQIQREHE